MSHLRPCSVSRKNTTFSLALMKYWIRKLFKQLLPHISFIWLAIKIWHTFSGFLHEHLLKQTIFFWQCLWEKKIIMTLFIFHPVTVRSGYSIGKAGTFCFPGLTVSHIVYLTTISKYFVWPTFYMNHIDLQFHIRNHFDITTRYYYALFWVLNQLHM